MLKIQHPMHGVKPTDEEVNSGATRKVFYDTEDIKKISKPDEYAVVIKSGLSVREGIQERQDACIRINVLNNQNMWAKPNMKVVEEIRKMIERFPDSPFLY